MALPEAIEEKISKLNSASAAWLGMSNEDRAVIARKCREQLATMDLEWGAESMRCQGLNPSAADSKNYISFEPFVFCSAVGERLDRTAEMLEGKLKLGESGNPVTMDRQREG